MVTFSLIQVTPAFDIAEEKKKKRRRTEPTIIKAL